MAAIIDSIIPMQGSEIVLNKIGVILFEELTKQKVLRPANDDFNVYVERLAPFDNSENVMINVSLNNANYSGFTQKDSQGLCSYFIDVEAGGTGSDGEENYEDVRKKMHLYLGMIRYILSSTKYMTLGFAPGLIGGKYVESMQFPDKYISQDSGNVRFGRITFTVRVQENQDSWVGIPLNGNDSNIKLELTELGYKLTNNN